MTNNSEKLHLGKQGDISVELSPSTLQTHCAILGSSGCGKTVAAKILIEEMALKNIPVIAVDPHGDVSSLVFSEDDSSIISEKNISKEKISKFKENVEVLIWTPGSTRGLPLCLNPLKFDDIPSNKEDRIKYLSYTAQILVSALDYDTKSQKSVYSIIFTILDYFISHNTDIDNFTKLIDSINDMPDTLLEKIEKLGKQRDINELVERLTRFTVASESLLFNTGTPLDIDLLLGKHSKTGKTRVSIIYLNSLSSLKEQEFFMSVLNQKIYHWMKKNESNTNQNKYLKCGYFIDEISPWIPPVRKPLCKESFERLFKESRKFGVSLIVATQSPGDIDYKVIAQVSTTLLGRIQTPQEIEKIKTKIKSSDNNEIKDILAKLPSIETGTFLVISNEFSNTIETKLRWLLTKHGIDKNGKNWLISLNDVKGIMKSKKTQIGQENISQDKNTTQRKKINDDKTVYMIENKIFQREVASNIGKYLKGGFIFKDEEYSDSEFNYMQLIRVELSYFKEKGFIRKRQEKINNINLYLQRIKRKNNKIDDYKILTYDKDEVIFESIIDKDPNQIIDLDDKCNIVKRSRSEARKEFEFRGRTRLNEIKMDIISTMEKKYNIEIKDVYWALFPYWKCIIKNKSNPKLIREIYIDGVHGNKINFYKN